MFEQGALADYRVWLALSKSPRTAHVYSRCVERLLEFARTPDPAVLTPATVTRFLSQFSPRWANCISYAVMSFLEFCGQDRVARMVPHPRFEQHPRAWLTEQQVLKMVRSTPNARDRALVWMGYEFALRVSELLDLKLEDVDLERKTLRFRRVKQRGGQAAERTLPMSERAHRYVADYLATRRSETTALFVRMSGAAMTHQDVTPVMRRLRRRAGMRETATFHAFRHGRATDLAYEGWSIYDLAAFLGHRNVNSTLIYTSHALERAKRSG